MFFYEKIILSFTIALAVLGLQQCAPKGEEKQVESDAKDSVVQQSAAERTIWSKEEANAWYAKQSWLVGCDFIPSSAINQLEMWQAETFDTATINRELGWAASIGMNTVRVYLHDLLYQQDSTRVSATDGRISPDRLQTCVLSLCLCCSILYGTPIPNQVNGAIQKPGVHNSGWVQNPGKEVLLDTSNT